MDGGNCTQVTEFLFTGFREHPGFQVTLFVLFLLIYVITLMGNLGMVFLIRTDARLKIPMYYFLGNLAVVDFCFSTVVTPNMLADLLADKKAISYSGCVAQVFLLCFFGVAECFLLATMAYDRYVAICAPLMYTVTMSPRLCAQLVIGSLIAGWLNGMAQATGILQLTFCGPNVINLFFCDVSPLLSLSTSDATISHIVLLTVAIGFGMCSSFIVLTSYIFILSAILRMHSTEGKRKAFNTCTSHLTVVSIFYGTCLFIHVKPRTNDRHPEDKWASVFYTVVTPMLNPLIYSLRNKEVKDALKRVISRTKISSITN
ncbi:olfactory receptor 1009-like [Alligator sinensis]|uniref:Olfactory receptor n=1 Tax=Alligator sinensis TaxID=38654 RepID=A0A1U7SAR4_ALLSI|nr:olfactory receptor 1009-like [Alligator sinensis]